MAADEYRRHAIECFRIADETISAQSRVLLIHIARSRMRLARRGQKNLTNEHLVLREQDQHVEAQNNSSCNGT